jgi:hypothetical protein
MHGVAATASGAGRLVGQVHDAGAECLGTGQLEGHLIAFATEQALAVAPDDREDQQVELVQQPFRAGATG